MSRWRALLYGAMLPLVCSLAQSSCLAQSKLPAWIIIEQHYSTGRINSIITKDKVRVKMPVATAICDSKKQQITVYSFKTMRYVQGPMQKLMGELSTLRPLNRETFAPWQKTGKGASYCGHTTDKWERKQISSVIPRPKHVVVTEYMSCCNDVALNHDLVRFMSHLGGVLEPEGLPLHLERRSYSPKRPGLDKTPFVILTTLAMKETTVSPKEFELPPGFTRTSNMESMLFADYIVAPE